MTSFTSGLADGGGRRVDARMRALGQPEEEETTARRWFPRVDSSFGSVLSDGERFKGREGLSHKTLTRGVRFFTKKVPRDWLSPLNRHRSVLISGLHGLHRKVDCIGDVACFGTSRDYC
jgi:hypothetical protein